MNLINKISHRKRQFQRSSKFEVVLKTDKNLSEEQINTIITIVKDGILSNAEPSNICINVMTSIGIYDIMILNRIKNGVEVIF